MYMVGMRMGVEHSHQSVPIPSREQPVREGPELVSIRTLVTPADEIRCGQQRAPPTPVLGVGKDRGPPIAANSRHA